MFIVILLIGVCVPFAAGSLGIPTFTLTPEGINVTFPVNNYPWTAVHFNINKPLPGVGYANFSKDFYQKDLNPGDTAWTHLFPTTAHEGDTINYWIWGQKSNGDGEQMVNLHTVLGPMVYPSSTTSTSEAPTTPVSPSTTLTDSKTSSTTESLRITTNDPMTSPYPDTTVKVQSVATNVNMITKTVDSRSTTVPGGSSQILTSTSANYVSSEHHKSTSMTSGNMANSWQAPSGGRNHGYSGSSCCREDHQCQTYPCLILNEEFSSLNPCLWEHEVTAGGNQNSEFQYYTNNRTNSYVRDGVLFIKPTLTADNYGERFLTSGTLDLWGGLEDDVCTSNAYEGCRRKGTIDHPINPVQSARLRTKNSFCLKYGKVEIEAKMPKGDWLLPYFKLLPKWSVYGRWPASGEIDVFEGRGNAEYYDDLGQSRGNDNIHTALHFGPSASEDRFYMASTDYTLMTNSFADIFHKYTIEWDANHITIAVDGREILRKQPRRGGFWELGGLHWTNMTNPWAGATMAPFDQEFYLVLGLAVGGTVSFPEEYVNKPYPKPWRDSTEYVTRDFLQAKDLWYPTWTPQINNGENAALQIRSIKVWKLKP